MSAVRICTPLGFAPPLVFETPPPLILEARGRLVGLQVGLKVLPNENKLSHVLLVILDM